MKYDYEGNILIPSRLYKKLGFHKYENPASDFPLLETVAGMVIKIRSAPAKLCIENLETERSLEILKSKRITSK